MSRPATNKSFSGVLSGRGLLRLTFLFCIAAAFAALAAAFGIARDYGFLRASILSGSPGGQYHAIATRPPLQVAGPAAALGVLGSAKRAGGLSRSAQESIKLASETVRQGSRSSLLGTLALVAVVGFIISRKR